MLANLLNVAGVKHVITVDLHASQMQGFFKCPVDNLHAEPIIARWIRRNVPNWREAVVVSKNAGGTKRVTSLADALKLNFGMVTTERKRGHKIPTNMFMTHLDGVDRTPALETSTQAAIRPNKDAEEILAIQEEQSPSPRVMADALGSPRRASSISRAAARDASSARRGSTTPSGSLARLSAQDEDDYNDHRPQEVTRGRLVHGHVVEDDFPSPADSNADNSPEEDPMAASRASSFFVSDKQALGGSSDPTASSDEEDNVFQEDSKTEHTITLVGDVKNRTVFIVDDMIDKPGSWIAAAETVVKRGGAKKVFCIATHGVFGGDCLERLQACECIDAVVVTNSFPISEENAKGISKLVILDLSILLSEAIRRNHYGESISPLFQHTD
jgi:ribose-phosphate pyrophosphokinase